FMELIFSTTAGGNVFSIPKTIPIFLALTVHSSTRVAHLKLPPPSLVILSEAEDPCTPGFINYHHPGVLTLLARHGHRATADNERQTTTKNISPPSSATKASHASNYPPKHPANLEPPWHSASPTV